MGPKERAVDFCPYITEVMYMNDNINGSDVANELEDYMDEHFNVQLEDNSSFQVADELLKFYSYCAGGNEPLAMQELEKLPPLQSWITSRTITRRDIDRFIEQGGDSSSDEDGDRSLDDAGEEWTEVRSRRKK